MPLSANWLSASIDSELHGFIASRCGIKKDEVLGYRIIKRSIDARKKPDVKLIYSLVADIVASAVPKNGALPPTPNNKTQWRLPDIKGNPLQNPVIVGAGPGGLFAALVLAMAGAKPIVFDRGYDVDRRKADIDSFFSTRNLNPESNLLFGEGGAGTWSDGKLYTRVRDERIDFVLKTFIDCGAPEQTGYFSHPHIGSDRLPYIVSAIRKKIIALGGEFRWGSRVENILIQNGRCGGVVLANREKIEAPAVIMACGHSARGLILSMIRSGVAYKLKGFQTGCRIEHPQSFINRIQFGCEAAPPALGSAEYNFASRPTDDDTVGGATSFCMCPGGEIIPGTSDPEQLSTNGMSNAARNGFFANSAIVTGHRAEDFRDAEEAFAFLEKLEKTLYRTGGSDYTCPAQTAATFLRGVKPQLPAETSYSLGLRACAMSNILPVNVFKALKRALMHFDKSAPGFVEKGVIVGMETRVSSPVRFERNAETFESSLPCLYTAGEGAGMAGGISSAAIDGMKSAEALLLKKY